MKQLEDFLEEELKVLELQRFDWGHLTIEDESRERTLLEVREVVNKQQQAAYVPNCDLSEFAINNFNHILEISQKITTGNVSHKRITIEGIAKRSVEFIKKYY